MHVVSQSLPRLSMVGQRPPQPQTGGFEAWEDWVFDLTDEIAEQEDIPHEVAYRYALDWANRWKGVWQ
jgi:hypothetical protein